jgi:nucleoid-associated protein YgaU
MTEAGSAASSAVDAGTWPVQCPVDQRWIREGDTCPDCGSSVAPLRSLNALAASLLDQASRCTDPSTAAALVSQASSLTPQTERFYEAAAEALEAAGRPDLALEQVNAALAIAPRRVDLQDRAAALAAQPVAHRPRLDQTGRWGALTAAAVVLIVVGAVGGGLVSRAVAGPEGASPTAAPSSVALASPTAAAGAPPTPTPGPTASPAPSEGAPPAASPDPSRLVRAALAAANLPGSERLAVELIGDTVRISGPVADADAQSQLKAAIDRALPGIKVDLDGVTFPRPRFVFVQPGDTLWSIAARTYGNPRRWRAIAAANPGMDPSNIRIGQRLTVP